MTLKEKLFNLFMYALLLLLGGIVGHKAGTEDIDKYKQNEMLCMLRASAAELDARQWKEASSECLKGIENCAMEIKDCSKEDCN